MRADNRNALSFELLTAVTFVVAIVPARRPHVLLQREPLARPLRW